MQFVFSSGARTTSKGALAPVGPLVEPLIPLTTISKAKFNRFISHIRTSFRSSE